MPISLAGNLVPKAGLNFFLLEDTYVKGGFRVVPSVEKRDEIPLTNLKQGQLVLTVAEKKVWQQTADTSVATAPIWEEFAMGGGSSGNGNGGKRVVATHVIDDLVSGADVEFELDLGVSCIVLDLRLDRKAHVFAYSTPEKDEVNPYEFLATDSMLADRGLTELSDGTLLRNRRYNLLCNMEQPPKPKHYFTVKSIDDVAGPCVLTLTFVPIESAPI